MLALELLLDPTHCLAVKACYPPVLHTSDQSFSSHILCVSETVSLPNQTATTAVMVQFYGADASRPRTQGRVGGHRQYRQDLQRQLPPHRQAPSS